MSKHSHTASFLLIGGGALTIGAAWLAFRKAASTTNEVERAIEGELPTPDADPSTRGRVQLRLTGYWPFTARDDEKKMEGGVNDRKGKPLYSLEQHLADPVKYPYVSLSGDDAIWPYGQRVIIDAWPNAIFRVVDTGSHFRGLSKIYRVTGAEPIDVCVNSSKTVVPKISMAKIVAGDNFDKGKAVASGKFKDQDVVVGYLSDSDVEVEVLARAIETELGGQKVDEQVAAAWAMRNRADNAGISMQKLLIPNRRYGAPDISGGFVSTRKQASEHSRSIALHVLGAKPDKDPTGGATDYWTPVLQNHMRRLGDVYRAAVSSGDTLRAAKYHRFAEYPTEAEVRAQHERDGLFVLGQIGEVELLGKVS